MSGKRIVVYGAGGHGKVVADILLASGVSTLLGFIDDDERRAGSSVLNMTVLGGADWLKREAARGEVAVALGVGDNSLRESVSKRCAALGVEILTLVHPDATVSRWASLGAGTVVMAGARINPAASLGRAVIVNTGAVVEHDVVVGDYAHLSPNAVMGGAARLGSHSHLGLGAVILPGVEVGDSAIIGAGAVVVKDIPNSVIATGIPARVSRHLQKSQPG